MRHDDLFPRDAPTERMYELDLDERVDNVEEAYQIRAHIARKWRAPWMRTVTMTVVVNITFVSVMAFGVTVVGIVFVATVSVSVWVAVITLPGIVSGATMSMWAKGGKNCETSVQITPGDARRLFSV
ncbi:hypothetical protein FN846DRAFT_999639 [Sphaerosporella brunnea]|uniref:Uncharacterized protein n=1 Tax=Sphaerosporella brunnea TaxID=1250544 RepID=A0A5J5EH45_9PEZI|nr:hypothetical protein FN846DRAFT_999639 [Sphaerosporella brunnea]